MDWVIPGSVDMTKVKFDAQSEDDCRHNFRLLNEAFSKSGLTRVGPFFNIGLALQFIYFFYVFIMFLKFPKYIHYEEENPNYKDHPSVS